MKYEGKDLEKWLRMHKRPFWEILQGDKKQGLFAFDENDSDLESSVSALNDALETLPNGEYKIRAKRKITDPNNAFLTVDFVINNSSNNQSSSKNSNTKMSEIEKLYSEKLQMALELQRKDFELKMVLEKFATLEKETKNEMKNIVNQFAEFQNEVYDWMDDGKINGSNKVKTLVEDGLNTAINHGTKAVIDRFSRYQS